MRQNQPMINQPLTKRDATVLAFYRQYPVAFVINELGGNPTTDQAKLLQACADLSKKQIILSAGRGAGKSRVVSWIVAWSMACLPDIFEKYNAVILGGSGGQSDIMYSYLKDDIYKTKYLESKLIANPTKRKTEFEGGFVKALTASETSVRGPHPELLILDEVAAAKDEIIRSALPMISGSLHGRIIMLSTPHKMFGVFQEYWDSAELYEYEKFGPWPLTNCHHIDQEWVERMRVQFTPQKFAVEILGEPVEGGALVFHDEWIDDCTATKPFRMNPNYDHDGGIDWGHVNPTVLVRVQGFIKNKLRYPGPEMEWQYKLFPKIQLDILGVFKTQRGSKYWADASHIGENQRMIENGINAEPVSFSRDNKQSLAELAQYLFWQGMIEISPDLEILIRQLKKYHWEELPGGKEKLTKDEVDHVEAFLLSLYSLHESGWLSEQYNDQDKWASV